MFPPKFFPYWGAICLLLSINAGGWAQCPTEPSGQNYLNSARDLYENQDYSNAALFGQKSLEKLSACGESTALPAYILLAEIHAAEHNFEESNVWASEAIRIQARLLERVPGLEYSHQVMEQQLRELAEDSSVAPSTAGFSGWQLVLLALSTALAGWFLGRKFPKAERLQTQQVAGMSGKRKLSATAAQGPATIPEQEPNNMLLTSRELEVLSLMASGRSNKDIAATLYISENTAKSHIANIYMKLEVNNRTEAARKATQLNLIEP